MDNPVVKPPIARESLAGLLLIGSAIVAMAVANSPWSDEFFGLLNIHFVVGVESLGSIDKPIHLWINDGLMSIFFLLVGLELKREMLQGALADRRMIALPLIAAAGGIICPALIYVAVNWGDPMALKGWAIPAATDIAFAMGILSMLGTRVPTSLKTFLLSLAVFDDLVAIIIIAAFYTESIAWSAMGLAGIAIVVMVAMNRLRIRNLGLYLMVGLFLWVCVLKTGVHATLAGVVIGLVVPLRVRDTGHEPPLIALEHALQPWVNFMVIPVFALANAGVRLTGVGLDDIFHPITLGIAGGLVLGKLIGAFGFAALWIHLGLGALPRGSNWRQLLGTCALAGIGFTMSLFIGTLAFGDQQAPQAQSLRLGVLGGSIIAAAFGISLLLRKPAIPQAPKPQDPVPQTSGPQDSGSHPPGSHPPGSQPADHQTTRRP
jgi:Na+:H+ antiporter, NhaA family